MNFMDIIYGMVIKGIGEDKMRWKPDHKKSFKVSTFYLLLGAPPSTSDQFFPCKIIWRSMVPLRVAFFVWTAALDKILTIDNLRFEEDKDYRLVLYVQM